MSEPSRKIVHIDMDAFYASVEQRDNPDLRGKPVVVAWTGPRSVVCAASYEARRFGVHSAMSAIRAQRLCPQAVYVPPDFNRYRDVSRQIRQIFARHTDLIEPLSLDEAYLDVTVNKLGLPSATEVAQVIRQQIRTETGLTASAGIAPNKFLAKIASDWNKPDGQFVIRPTKVLEFLQPLPVRKVPGVGKVTQARLEQLASIPWATWPRTVPKNSNTTSAAMDGACLNWRGASTNAKCRPTSRCSRCRPKPRFRKISGWMRWAMPSTVWRTKYGTRR